MNETTVQLVQLFYSLGGACSPGTAAKKWTGPWQLAHFAYRHNIVQIHCFDPTSATWAQLGVNFGQQGPNLGPTWQPWPILGTQRDTLKACIVTAISNVFGPRWRFMLARPCSPHVACHDFGGSCPHTCQVVPKAKMVALASRLPK